MSHKATPFNAHANAPKPEPPKDSWWLCDPKDFVLRHQQEQGRMNASEKVFLPKPFPE